MSRDPDLLLRDILLCCKKVQNYTQGLDRSSFEEDTRTVDAVLRNLEIMGEAVKSLPSSMIDDHPDVDWRGIAGLRDVVIHAYFGIDMEIVWDVVENKVTPSECSEDPGIMKPIRFMSETLHSMRGVGFEPTKACATGS